MTCSRLASTALSIAALSSAAFAELPTGEKTITLHSVSERVTIGTVTFQGQGAMRKISVHLNEDIFKDHFLSMRPFKCIEGSKFYCHLPYPYEWKGEVTEADLTDLEYALLFVQKDPAAYGINLWHGVYYKLLTGPDGKITGSLHEVDMDVLASPPPPGQLRPITPDLLNKADAKGQWLPELLIE